MDKLIAEVSSVYWWIGVVAVGIVINILSSYIRKIMESRLSKVSIYWKEKRKEREEKNAKIIEVLRNNNELKMIFALRESRYRIRCVLFIVLGSLGMNISILIVGHILYISIIAAVIAAVSILFALEDQREAVQVKYLVEKSTDGIDELNT